MGRCKTGNIGKARGERLGRALARHRGATSQPAAAARAGVSVDALRKIEQGHVASPSFFTVVDVAAAIGVDVAELAREAGPAPGTSGRAGA